MGFRLYRIGIIVDDAIDFQVDASNLSVDAQKKIEDLDEVSKKFGGGGHKKAAGFRLPGDTKIDDLFEICVFMMFAKTIQTSDFRV